MIKTLKIINLSHRVKNDWILKDINININLSSDSLLYGIFGKHDSGKSSLLRCICNLDSYKYGDVLINGDPVRKLSYRQKSRLISYLPQYPSSFNLTVSQLVLMGRNPHLSSFFPSNYDKIKAVDAIDMMGIRYISDIPYNILKMQDKKLVLMAQILAQDTPIVLLDEPMIGLDFNIALYLWEIIKELNEIGKLVIISSNNISDMSNYVDNVYVLHKGELISNGSPDKILNKDLLNKIYL